MRTTWAVAMLVFLAGCSSIEAPTDEAEPAGPDVRDDPPPWRPNLWLLEAAKPTSSTVSGGAEPSMLASKDGRHLWIGDTDGLSISTDNGTTWRSSGIDFTLTADGWSLGEDDAGNLFMSTTSTVSIVFARSSDGGFTADHMDEIVDVAPVADRPYLAARGDGEVAIIMYDFGRTTSETCVRSTDGGETWLDRSLLSGSAIGGNLQFDDAGALVFADLGRMWRYDSCTVETGSAYIGGDYVDMYPGGIGANNHVQVATEDGAYYTALAGPGNKEIIIAAMETWGGPVKHLVVSPPVLKSNTFAAISVHDGEIAVAWYGSETPGDPSQVGFDGAFNVYVAQVRDFWGTPSITHTRLTTEPNHVGDICMGGIGCTEEADRDLLDYFGVDHDIWGGVHVAYGHDGTGSRADAEVRHGHIPPRPIEEAPEVPVDLDDLPPIPAFEVIDHRLTVKVDASASEDPEGGELSHLWTWGDGSPATSGAKAMHTYDRYGAFAITLTVADEAGNKATLERRMVVGDNERFSEPEADFSNSPVDPVAGAAVVFRDRSTDADDDIVSRLWDFGDGETSEEEAPRHFFDRPGRYTVRLEVTDDWGMTDVEERELRVRPADDVDDVPEPQAVAPTKESPGLGAVLVGVLAALAWMRKPQDPRRR